MASRPAPTPIVVITDLNFPSDDYQALSLLLGMPEVTVVHIVATDGNTWAEEVLENVSAVLAEHGRADIPVTLAPFAYRHEMRGRALRAYRRRNKSFLGPYFKSWRPRSPVPAGHPALSSLASTVAANASELVILSLAPLHPIGALLDSSPDLLGRVGRILVMAGNFLTPNRSTPEADFNVWFDPYAATRLFGSGLPISLVPRNACNSCVLDEPTLAGLDTAGQRARNFLADVVGMLTQHGPDFPLIDTILPLLLVEPRLVVRSRTGIVHVRRRPLEASGRTYFRERPDGNVTLVDELDPERVRDCLRRRLTDLDSPADPVPAHLDHADFRVRTCLRQRLVERPFYQLDVGNDGTDVERSLDLASLCLLHRMIVGLRPDATTTVPGRLGREATVTSALVQADAVARYAEGGDLASVGWLCAPAGWRCPQFSRLFGTPVREGDAVLQGDHTGDPRMLDSTRAALIRWWLAECDRRGVRPGRLIDRTIGRPSGCHG